MDPHDTVPLICGRGRDYSQRGLVYLKWCDALWREHARMAPVHAGGPHRNFQIIQKSEAFEAKSL